MALDLQRSSIEALIESMLKNVTDKSKGVEDLDALRNIYAEECAKVLIETIKKSTVTIDAGLISVQGVGNLGVPVLSTNSTPIIIEGGIS
jgi:hypothetical protein